MAGTMACGFEIGSLTDDGWNVDTTGGTVAISSAQAKTGTYSCRVNRTGANPVGPSVGTTLSTLYPSGSGSGTTAGYSFWFYVAALPSSGQAEFFIPMGSTTTSDVGLSINSSGDIKIHTADGGSGGNTIGTVSTGSWHLIEFRISYASNPTSAAARLDGGTEQTWTIAQAASTKYGFILGTYNTNTATFDIYYDDVVATDANAYPGDMRVYMLRPNGDVDTNWSITGGDATRWEATDDNPTSTTTYINSSTSGQVQRLDMTTQTVGGSDTITFIDLRGIAGSNSTTGTRNVNVNLQSSGGTDGSTKAWSYDTTTWLTNPRGTTHITSDVPGGTGWSQSDLDGIRFKVTKDANTNVVRISDVWAYVAVAVTAGPVTVTVDAATATAAGGAVGALASEAVTAAAAQAAGEAVAGRAAAPVTSGSAAAAGSAVGAKASAPVTAAAASAAGEAVGAQARAGVTSGAASAAGETVAAKVTIAVQAATATAQGETVMPVVPGGLVISVTAASATAAGESVTPKVTASVAEAAASAAGGAVAAAVRAAVGSAIATAQGETVLPVVPFTIVVQAASATAAGGTVTPKVSKAVFAADAIAAGGLVEGLVSGFAPNLGGPDGGHLSPASAPRRGGTYFTTRAGSAVRARGGGAAGSRHAVRVRGRR